MSRSFGRSLVYLPAACVLVFIGAAPLSAAELDVNSAIDAVTVYPDGATVTRVLTVDLPQGDSTLIARDFPPGLDVTSLRVEGDSAARVTIGAIDARAPRPTRPATAPEIEKRIEALKDERAMLEDKIAAEAARKKFAQRFANETPFGLGEKGEARPISDWRGAFRAVSEEISSADEAIRVARLRQREIDRALAALDAELSANPARKMEVRVDLSAEAAARGTFRVSYTVRGARWAPLYDARLDSGSRERKPSLELVRRAEIVQHTGEDWRDVSLSVSTVRTAKGGSAPELSPLIVRYPAPPSAGSYRRMDALPRTSAAEGENFMAMQKYSESDRTAAAAPPAPAPAREAEAVIETGGYQVVFRVPGRISVGADEGAKSFRIATGKIAPELLVRATPALDETAYLEAAFKQTDEAPLLPGRISLYRDGIFVGRGQMALTPKDETARLGFGADDKVKVARATVRKVEGSAGIISSARTDEREYKITVRSGHDRPIKVVVEDQVPTTEVADIQVELLPVTTTPSEKDSRDRRGVLAWNLDAAPGEAKEIKLGWRMRWPADKIVAYEPRRP